MKLALENIRLLLGPLELAIDCVLEGRLTGIFGPSGAGKTSLLEIIAGLRRPRSGRATLDDRTLFGDEFHLAARHRRIGYVPQDLALFPHLSVRNNLAYGMPATRDLGTLEAVGKILEIEHLLSRLPANLSGGERQRVALARAVLAKPSLLLLDEPLSSLDRPLKERLFPHLLRIRDEIGIPMLYVTHSADELRLLCDDTLVLEAGRIVAQGPPASLFVPTGETRYRLKLPA